MARNPEGGECGMWMMRVTGGISGKGSSPPRSTVVNEKV